MFASNANSRAEVVPGPAPEVGEQLALLDEEQGGPPTPKRPRRHQWARPLSRVFGVDIIECPRCGGRLGVVVVVSEPADIARQRVLHERVARAPPPSKWMPSGELAMLLTNPDAIAALRAGREYHVDIAPVE